MSSLVNGCRENLFCDFRGSLTCRTTGGSRIIGWTVWASVTHFCTPIKTAGELKHYVRKRIAVHRDGSTFHHEVAVNRTATDEDDRRWNTFKRTDSYTRKVKESASV